MLGYKKGNERKISGSVPQHYPADRVYLDGDTSKNVQELVARKKDLTDLNLTGTKNTTGSTRPSGYYFYLNGTLVRAKTAIANGATFTVNTNYEIPPDGGLNQLTDDIILVTDTVSLGALSSGASGYKEASIQIPTGYTSIMATVNHTSPSSLGGDLLLNVSTGGSSVYITYRTFASISSANSTVRVRVLCKKS